LLVFALAVVLFMAALDQTVVGTALPRIAADLGGLEWYAWVFTAYMLATTAVVPVAGKLGDLYGRRLLLIVGIVEFLISSALAGFANSMELLVIMRALQGVGAGILAANSQAALGDLFPPAQLGKYNGMLSGVYALASLVGPVLGGAITDGVGWRWVFLVNLPVGLLALFVVMRWFRPSASGRAREPLDLSGMILLVMAVVAWLAAFSGLERAAAGEWLPTTAASLAALVLTGVFVRVELRTVGPVLPIPLLLERELRATLIITGACGMGIYTLAIFTPLMLQGSLGLSPSAAGLAMTPMVFGLVFGGIVGGVRVSRVGRYRTVIGAGLVIATIAAALLASSASVPNARVVAGWLGLVGFGAGMTIPALMSAAQNAVVHTELGLATSLSKFARTFGGIVGLGMLGATLQVLMVGELDQRLARVLGREDAELARTLARDPGALLEADSTTLAGHPALIDDPQRLADVLALLREVLAHATAGLLWAVCAMLGFATLMTLRLSDRPLRRDFEASERMP
jgi:EmrB/QacA subfamily drug resistance transporter